MASVKEDTTITEYQIFVKEVYGLRNDRDFSVEGVLSNIVRFAMRGLKGIRKGDKEKTKLNLLISQSWFMSLINQFHINIEEEIWKRFPYVCSYCGSCPCFCKEEKIEERRKISIDESKRPKTMKNFQEMFSKIYPPEKRFFKDAAIHLSEELGELSEVILIYRGQHRNEDFKKIALEAADLFSCYMGILNSLGIDVAKELSIMFSENCHVCKKAPCQCSFEFISQFKS